jgi:CO/xanthine dehydrogenase Mo-binding subunit
MPKELAQFTWEEGEKRKVEVCQNGRTLCSLASGHPLRLWRQSMSLAMFGIRPPDLLGFEAKLGTGLGLSGGTLQVPAESPFAGLGLGRPWLVLHGREANFTYTAPESISLLRPAPQDVV